MAMYPGYGYGTYVQPAYVQQQYPQIQPQYQVQYGQYGQPQQLNDLRDESQWRSLYVGNLPTSMPDMLLYEIFATIAPVSNWKIIKDKATGKSLGYGFIDYFEHEAAKTALETLNGRKILENEVKVNWAHIANGNREDPSTLFTLFVGDLSGDVIDKVLQKAFSSYGEVVDARVMMDPNTGRSRGFGFVSFRSKGEADTAMAQMNGEWLGSRAVRVNWANTKSQTQPIQPQEVDEPGIENNTSVYVGNLPQVVTEENIRQIFSDFLSYVDQIRVHKGYAFVHFKSHQYAKQAITTVSGRTFIDRPIKCGWGKERAPTGNSAPSVANYSPVSSPYLPQYQYSYSQAGSTAQPSAGVDAYGAMTYYPQYYGTQYYGYAATPAGNPYGTQTPYSDLGNSILGLPPAPNTIPKQN